MQEKRCSKHWFSFMCLMPRFRSSLLWFLGVLCSFIFARMRVGLNTQLRTCECMDQFWWQIFLGRLAQTMQTCKGLFFFKRTFFAEGHPDGVRKYAQMRPKYGNIYPVWTRPKQRFKKKAPFFPRPSVKSFSHTPYAWVWDDVWGCGIQHQAGQAQNVHMIQFSNA